MTYQFEKHFTLEQANSMVPHIRRLFAEIKALLTPPAPPHNAGIPVTGTATPNGNGNGHSNGNGNGNHHPAGPPAPSPADYSGWTEEKRHEAAYRLLNALQSQGIVIQDVERGLIDFPAIIEGREVFLCYELADGISIGYFHDIDAGYAGRQEI